MSWMVAFMSKLIVLGRQCLLKMFKNSTIVFSNHNIILALLSLDLAH